MNRYNGVLNQLERNGKRYFFDLDTNIKFPSTKKDLKQFFSINEIKKFLNLHNPKEPHVYEKLDLYSLVNTSLLFTLSPENFLFMIGIFFTYISHIKNKSKMNTIHIPLFVSRRLTKYFLKLHMRNNLQKLYELYLLELITNQNTLYGSRDIEDFRKLITDVENYIKLLPSPRKLFASVVSLGIAVFGFIPIIGFNFNFIEEIKIFYENNFLVFIVTVIILYFIAFMISFPFKHAFKVKRMLFLKTNSFHYFNDRYAKNDTSLYDDSIYKAENNLYKSLGLGNAKPLEIPFDARWDTLLGIAIVIFVTGFITAFVYSWILTSEDFYLVLVFSISITILIDMIPIWHLIINPYKIYQSRIKQNLV